MCHSRKTREKTAQKDGVFYLTIFLEASFDSVTEAMESTQNNSVRKTPMRVLCFSQSRTGTSCSSVPCVLPLYSKSQSCQYTLAMSILISTPSAVHASSLPPYSRPSSPPTPRLLPLLPLPRAHPAPGTPSLLVPRLRHQIPRPQPTPQHSTILGSDPWPIRRRNGQSVRLLRRGTTGRVPGRENHPPDPRARRLGG